jgi:hypothetical protein
MWALKYLTTPWHTQMHVCVNYPCCALHSYYGWVEIKALSIVYSAKKYIAPPYSRWYSSYNSSDDATTPNKLIIEINS